MAPPTSPHKAPAADGKEQPAATETHATLGDVMWFESDLLTDAIVYLYRLRADGGVESGGSANGSYLAKWIGPVDFDAVRERFGGGRYRVRAKSARHEYLGTEDFDIEGAPIPVKVEVPAPPAPAPVPTAPAVVDAIAVLTKQLEELRTELRARPAVAPTSELDSLERAARMLRELTPAPAPVLTPASQIEGMLGLYTRGLEDGRRAEGGGSIPELIREALPLVRAMISPRVVAVRPGPRATSSAQLVEAGASGAAATPAPVSTSPVDARELLLVEMLARAVNFQLDPEELADSLDSLLSDVELEAFVIANGAQLLQRIEPVLEQYPELRQAHVAGYIDQVIAVLKTRGQEEISSQG